MLRTPAPSIWFLGELKHVRQKLYVALNVFPLNF